VPTPHGKTAAAAKLAAARDNVGRVRAAFNSRAAGQRPRGLSTEGVAVEVRSDL
jgi:hypothetical protein